MDRITLVGHLKIHPGKYEEFAQVAKRIMALVEDEPDVQVYEWYIDKDSGACEAFETYKDSKAVIGHMTGPVGAALPELFQFADIVSIDLYGELTPEARELTAAFPITHRGLPAFSASK